MPSPAPQAVGDEPDHTLQGSEMKGGAMKIQHGLLIAGSLLLAAGCSNDAAAPAPAETAQADTAAVETEVRNFIEQYNADYGANDLDKYFTSFAPDLTQWWPSGRVDLQTYETGWRKNIANGGGNAKVAVTDQTGRASGRERGGE